MSTATELLKGLEILAKYQDGGMENLQVEAQHDVIMAGPMFEEEDVFSQEDKDALLKIGWHWDEDGQCWALFT